MMSEGKSTGNLTKIRKSLADLILSVCEQGAVSVSYIEPQDEATHFLVRITSAVTIKQRKRIPKVWHEIPIQVELTSRVRKQ